MQANLYIHPGLAERSQYRAGIIRELSCLWSSGPGGRIMEAARKQNQRDVTSEGYKRLAIMVIIQAARDAYTGDTDAKTWLETTAPDWLESLGIPVTSWFYRDWLAAGFPGVVNGRGFRGIVERKRSEN